MTKKVFQILVPEDTLVSRIIGCENQVTELFVIDRADKKFVSEYSSDLSKPALYILINRDEKQLYVVETDDSLKRLRNHEAKDFWTEAIVFHSTADTLSTTEVKWLEAKTYSTLRQLGYYDLSENKQIPQEPPIKRNQIYTLETLFEEAKKYICAAGFDIFLRRGDSPNVAQTINDEKKIDLTQESLKGKDIRLSLNGKGKYTKRSFFLNVVKLYIEEHPETTFDELKQIFPQELAGAWGKTWPLLQKDFKYIENPKYSSRYKGKNALVLTTGDGVRFMVLNQWDYSNLYLVLEHIKGLGMSFEIINSHG